MIGQSASNMGGLERGLMTELLTAAQMRAVEAAAIASGAVTGLELMERAGRGVVDAVFAEWPELAKGGHRAVVLCGPGNNGGDGFVVARLLKEAGWEVLVHLYGTIENLPADARANAQRWSEATEVAPWPQAQGNHPRATDLVIDAVFGNGLNRPLPREVADVVKVQARARWPGARVVAVDCPSGLDMGTGDADRFMTGATAPYVGARAITMARLTVTFHAPKLGHYLGDGPAVCGDLRVVDIGLWSWDAGEAVPGCDARTEVVRLIESRYHGKSFRSGAVLKGMLEKHQGHKFDHGSALVLSGGVGRGGAARLAARGALRIGAGLVTVGCPPAALIEIAAQVTAIMLRSVKDAAALAEWLEEDARISAICVGPGFGTEAREAGLVRAILAATGTGTRASADGDVGVEPHPTKGGAEDEASSRRCVVLDGDALTLLARDADLFGMLHDRCVLTPHGGEFARLFPDLAEKLAAPATAGPAYSKVDAARAAAVRAGCVVLFKGPDTVIAAPDGRCSVNSAHYDRAAPWLATAGSGDVLSGFVTGLLARGFAPMQAAETAAWLHVECARAFGPGLIAEDLPEQVPGVLRDLGVA